MRSQAQLSHPNSYLQLTLLSCLEHWQVVRPAGLLGFQMLLPQSLSEHWEGGSKSSCWEDWGSWVRGLVQGSLRKPFLESCGEF